MFKSLPLFAALAACLASGGCQSVNNLASSTGDASLVAVAKKIDAGAQLAIADLPSACQIVAQISALASAYSATGLSGGGAASTVAKAATGAAVVANSSLCQNPAAADPVAVSIQILNAVAAVKAATRGNVTAPAAAAAVPSGN